MGCGKSIPRRGSRRGMKLRSEVAAFRSGSLTHHPTRVDEIVANHAEGNPTLHSGVGFVPAATLIRPSHPVRHFWPSRNQRSFCSRLRWGLLLNRLGMHTRLTPIASMSPTLPTMPPPPDRNEAGWKTCAGTRLTSARLAYNGAPSGKRTRNPSSGIYRRTGFPVHLLLRHSKDRKHRQVPPR
jgi:hypothetical protein